MAFDPFTLIGAVISGVGSVMSGMAAAAAAEDRARIAEMNKRIAEQNADRAIERTQVEAQDQDMQTLAALGSAEAVAGASGLSGRSQMLARKTIRELGRRDTLNVRQAGEIEAYNYKVDGANFQGEANAARREAGFSMLSGFLGAASSLVSAAKPTSFRTPRGLLAR